MRMLLCEVGVGGGVEGRRVDDDGDVARWREEEGEL